MISLTPNEVERRFVLMGIPNWFSDEEKQELVTTQVVPVPDGVMAFPTPRDNRGLNILKLRGILGTDPSKQPSFFDHPWYLEEDFATVDCQAGWHLLHMNVLPDSISQPVNYFSSLPGRGLELPAAIEVVLMVFLHFVGTGEQLLQKKHTWCTDDAGLNRFVTVGAFGRNGLFISGHPGGYASRGLGICGKIMR